MKINITIDCSPEEARRFIGLPDVEQANRVYMDNLTKAISGATSVEQLQGLAQQLAPMGQMGLKLLQGLMESGAAFTGGGQDDTEGAKKK